MFVLDRLEYLLLRVLEAQTVRLIGALLYAPIPLTIQFPDMARCETLTELNWPGFDGCDGLCYSYSMYIALPHTTPGDVGHNGVQAPRHLPA